MTQRTPRTRLSPAERHERSREAQTDRIMGLVGRGESLATISLREHMPRYATLQRWRATDSAFRARHESALTFQEHLLADQILSIANDCVAAQRGRDRIKALRFQVAARKWWVEWYRKTIPKNADDTRAAEIETRERWKRAKERIRRQDEEGTYRSLTSDCFRFHDDPDGPKEH